MSVQQMCPIVSTKGWNWALNQTSGETVGTFTANNCYLNLKDRPILQSNFSTPGLLLLLCLTILLSILQQAIPFNHGSLPRICELNTVKTLKLIAISQDLQMVNVSYLRTQSWLMATELWLIYIQTARFISKPWDHRSRWTGLVKNLQSINQSGPFHTHTIISYLLYSIWNPWFV